MKEWTAEELQRADWFRPLLEQVQQELNRLTADRHDRRPALLNELEAVRKQIQGWSLSLANPDLNQATRTEIEADLGKAVRHREELKRHLDEANAIRRQTQVLVDPEQIADRLNRLAEVLAANNPTRGNLELSLHVDVIRCYEDGRVVVRTCKLGALAGTTELLAAPVLAAAEETTNLEGTYKMKPRRRPMRRVGDGDSSELRTAAETATDVERFTGLGAEWFWEDEFRIPEANFWSKENAAAVAELRAQGWTHERLASHFEVTVPTIRKALRIAAATDASLAAVPRKMPRGRWAEQHAEEVAGKRKEGLTMKQLARHFGKSEPILRQAIRHAATHTPNEKAVDGGDQPSTNANHGTE
jgi:uncharacterized protein (DUF433 family)